MKALLTRPLALLAWGLALQHGPAAAHEMTMAEMQLRETQRGEFIWQWTAANDRRPASQDLTPLWPTGCQAEAATLRCGAQGLSGTLAIDGVGKRYSAALVKVTWLDGSSRVYTLTGAQPTVQLYGAADDPRGMGEVASAYTLLGVEHILGGIDHLMFVVGLLFLVGFERRLVWTITAFTAAHSLTLASSALGWLTLRPRRWRPASRCPSCWWRWRRCTGATRWRGAGRRWWPFCSAWSTASGLPVHSRKSVCRKTTCWWRC